MGNKDYYVASIKGKIYSLLSSVNVVDISHEIKPFDIAHASYVLRNCFDEFPIGSVHIVGVNPESTDDIHHCIIKFKGHYFIGADNGFFSLLCGIELPDKIVRINSDQEIHNLSFPTKNIFVAAAVALISGTPMENLGELSETIIRKQLFRPTAEENVIKGTVSYIDAYGNIITNITKELFDEICKGRTFSIYLTRAGYTITKIHNKYNEVPQGEKVALFSSTGTLEISINKGVEGSGGGANKLFGIKLNDTITIEFNDLKQTNALEL